PLAEVAPHGDVDDPARRVGHQAAHRAELADVALVPSGAGRGHHRDRAVRLEALHHLVRERGRGLLPDVDDLLVALVVGDHAPHPRSLVTSPRWTRRSTAATWSAAFFS